jgi:YkoY family integral membrane protein
MVFGLTSTDLATVALTIAWLVVLEGLLSGDNALVLAVMVRHLPKGQQKRALLYGIWGAIVFRLIAVISADYLLRFWQLKVVGGLYLVFLAIRHFLLESHDQHKDAKTAESFGRGFWGTVISVELADIAFSIDSILAAMALVETLPQNLQDNWHLSRGIIYLGGVLGIVMMRLVAGVFIKVLDKYKGLAAGAYLLVAWIGIRLAGGGLHDAFDPKRAPLDAWAANSPRWVREFPWEMHNWLFWGGMVTIVVLSIVLGPKGQVPPHKSEPTSPIDPES